MKRSVTFVAVLLFMISFGMALSAEITTEIDGEVSNFILETSSSSSAGFDAYDVEVPEYPDDSYAQLSSVVQGKNLMLDSFDEEADRALNLVYNMGSAVNSSEEISFTWDSSDFDNYSATIYDYGDDPSRGSIKTYKSINDYSSYTSPEAASGYNPRYYQIIMTYNEPGPSPTPTPTPSPGNGGGGGGGGGGGPSVGSIIFNPTELNFNLVVGRTKSIAINITNLADAARNISLSHSNLDGIAVFNDSTLSFAPGETREEILTFAAPNSPGVYAGIVSIGGNEIPTTINVRTKELLFDAMIVVPEKSKKIDPSGILETQVTLIPMGEDGDRVDVTLNYVIRDFDGNIYLIESETILVDSQKSFKKSFNTNNLLSGNYLIALELVYPNGVAISSSHFSVVSGGGYLVEIGFLASIIMVLLAIMIFWRISLITGKQKVTGKQKKKSGK